MRTLLGHLTRKLTRDRLDKFLGKYRSSNHDVLDLGTGSSPYRKYFPNATRVDINPSVNVDVIADAHSLPFADETFSLIVCTEVLEHLKEPCVAIEEMKRVLKKGGRLILTTRFIYPLHDTPNDFFRFTRYGLLSLFSNWRIVKLQEDAGVFETIAVLLQRLGFQAITRPEFLRFAFFPLAHIIYKLSFLDRGSYGSIDRSRREKKSILASGYYIVCQKI